MIRQMDQAHRLSDHPMNPVNPVSFLYSHIEWFV